MVRITLITMLFMITSMISSQSISVSSIKKIELKSTSMGSFPKFSSDDSKLIITSANYSGLFSYNLKNEELSIITESNGAGYNPIIDNDIVIFRTFDIKNGKKYHSINSFDLKTKRSEILEADKRSLKLPSQTLNRDLYILNNFETQKLLFQTNSVAKSNVDSKAIFVEDNNLYLVDDKTKKILNPLGSGVYVWESFSKDGSKIVFSFGNKGTFVCDLEGTILHSIENAHYPKFSPDGKFISYMIDEDDGYNYTSSDIFVYSLENQLSFEITTTTDKIEMFAEWSNDGNKLVYNTTDGEVFISTIQINY